MVNAQYELKYIYEFDPENIYSVENSRVLTYAPNTPFLYVSGEYFYLRPNGGGKGGSEELIYEFTNPEYPSDSDGYPIGYTDIEAEIYLENIAHVNAGENSYSLERPNVFANSVQLRSNEEVLLNLTNYGLGQNGLALNPSNNHLYFIANGSQGFKTFYSYAIGTGMLEELSTSFGNAPCCNYRAMHFIRGQNKIMMVDYESGDFYTYDLNTDLVELYAETDLQYVTGIVNKHDFLGNVEIYNQGETKIYPNPIKENLYINTNSQIEKIELFNIIGQKVGEFKPGTKVLNFSDKVNGIYILRIKLQNGKVETKKIIKN